MSKPLCLLTVAGSDSGGGAGIQADLKTFAAHGVYGLSVLTSVTAQNTRGVRDRMDLPAAVVDAQLSAVLEDLPVDGIKIGMLGNGETARVMARRLASLSATVPVVLDPVVLAGSGDRLLDREAESMLVNELFPQATVVTPNLPEARLLAAMDGEDSDPEALAIRLAEATGAVLVKGGHAEGEEIDDVLVTPRAITRFRHARLRREKVHGTGCTLSSALAVRLARGEQLPDATAGAIAYVRVAIEESVRLGGGQWVMTHPPEVTRSVEGGYGGVAIASMPRST